MFQNFSSIVGPNGSGKSNVIDAMLFVFGYRSKMIRTKKVSQLIHNSENHQNVQSCTVAVHFQKIVDLVSVLTDFLLLSFNDYAIDNKYDLELKLK